MFSCAQTPVTPEEVEQSYLGDAAGRRAALEGALWQPELPYSRSLLANYGLEDAGWELLPVLPVVSRPFYVQDSDTIAQGNALVVDGEPLDMNDSDLGRRMFFEAPMRYDAYLTWLATRPELWSQAGLDVQEDGSVRGLLAFRDLDGSTRVGMSCSLCHAEEGVAGRASRGIDLGWVRARYAEWRGVSGELFETWGPGRVDVTDDGVNGPTAIPDLWGLEHAQYLNHSGSVAVPTAASMAVRFETQMILGHRMQSRPDRRGVWALMEFVRSLEPDAFALSESPRAAEGQTLFDAMCAQCHNPQAGFSGGLVAAQQLTSDPTIATTPERGTGYYKVPSLIRVSQNAPYLADGSQPSLEALLASGHPFGTPPSLDERAALIDYLKTL